MHTTQIVEVLYFDASIFISCINSEIIVLLKVVNLSNFVNYLNHQKYAVSLLFPIHHLSYGSQSDFMLQEDIGRKSNS